MLNYIKGKTPSPSRYRRMDRVTCCGTRRCSRVAVVLFAVMLLCAHFCQKNQAPLHVNNIPADSAYARFLPKRESEKSQRPSAGTSPFSRLFNTGYPSKLKNAPTQAWESSPPYKQNPAAGLVQTTVNEVLGKCAADLPELKTCDPSPCNETQLIFNHTLLEYPRHTKDGTPTTDFVQSILHSAWGKHPPSIDLYVRTGCMGAYEMQWLWKTLELFWPDFLGKIIVVLDVGNESAVLSIIPKTARHRFAILVVYEHCPCMSGRIFNQLSYMRADRYTTADYLVTIDSDCALYRPVTPDVLFNQHGELYLVTNRLFQLWEWNKSQYVYTGKNNRRFGHAMTTQPITFKTSSFGKYRAFIQNKFGECYERQVVIHNRQAPGNWFCWMCQLQTYLMMRNSTGYEFRILNQPGQVYLRFAAHVSYEHVDGSLDPVAGDIPTRYEATVNALVNQGLCLWFGHDVFPECFEVELQGFSYLERLMTTYNMQVLQPLASRRDVTQAILQVKERLKGVVVTGVQ